MEKMKQKFDITGMTCSACSSRVEKCVRKLEGIEQVSVNLLTNNMQVEYNEEKLSKEQIVNAVIEAGYGASVPEQKTDSNVVAKGQQVETNRMQEEQKAMKQRLWISFLFLIPLMYVSMGHMMGLPMPSFLAGHKNAVAYGFTQFLLCIPIVYVNRKYYQVGFKTLFHGSPNMDSLIAIGSTAALVYGVFAIYRIGYGLGIQDMELVERYHMDLYFESAGTILALITLGKYLETKSKGKTSEAITKLMNLAPKTASVERNGVEVTIPVEEVMVDDIFFVKPGSTIPVDGMIIEGSSSLDESAITGESIPVEKKSGDLVVAATINKAGFLKCKATKVGNDTTLAKIIQLVEEASSSKAPIAKMADKIAGIFVPVVIIIAIAAVIIWLFTGATFEFALSIGIAVLVISCPCALGLATPVAIMVGTGKGAEHGILIKSGEALEIAHSIDTVVLDKTGTITEGKPRVTDVIVWKQSKQELIQIGANLEKSSEHPLAEAIIEYALEQKITPEEVEEFQAIFGKGVTAKKQGIVYYAGNEALMKEKNISIGSHKEKIDQIAKEGKTPLLFANETELIGMIAVADVVKKTSKQAIEEWKRLGIEVVMLTGDNKRTAEAIKTQLAIPKVIAEVLPQDKERTIAQIQEEGHKVAMIGDGINDAPALARADVGIAIGAGTDVAIESADIVLMKNDLLDAVTAIRLSKAVIRNIKENLFWAFFYNSVGIPLAAGVFYSLLNWKLNPMFGAAAMSLSSVCVVSNALRLKMFQVNYKKTESSKEQERKEDLELLEEQTINDRRKKEMEEKKVIIHIEGMSCGHCTGAVTKALNAIDGVSAEVSLEDKAAYVTLTQEVDQETLKKAIEAIDFKVTKIEV